MNFVDGRVTQAEENNYLLNIYDQSYHLNFYGQNWFAEYVETGIPFVTLQVERRS